jgi:hypothetical protein
MGLTVANGAILAALIAVHVWALVTYGAFAKLSSWEWERFTRAYIWLPLFWTFISLLTHVVDKQTDFLRGFTWKVRKTKPTHVASGDTPIARQSIFAAIGIGVVVALVTIDGIWDVANTDRFIVAGLAVMMLGLSTLSAMLSVLCYAHAVRFDEHEVRRRLFRKAWWFDRTSWHTLMIGLVWAIAIADTTLSIWANLIYFLFLFFYYFFFWDETDAARQGDEKPVRFSILLLVTTWLWLRGHEKP